MRTYDGRISMDEAAENIRKNSRELLKCGIWWGEEPDLDNPVSPLGKHASGEKGKNCQKSAKSLRGAKHRKTRNAEFRAAMHRLLTRLLPKNR